MNPKIFSIFFLFSILAPSVYALDSHKQHISNKNAKNIRSWNPEMDEFDPGIGLPKNYNGARIQEMIEWILNKVPKEKNEFEKNSDYEKIISQIEGEFSSKLFAFKLKDLINYQKYDPNQEAYIPPHYHNDLSISSDKEFTLLSKSTNIESYVASTVFNKRVIVKKFSDQEYGIFLSKNDLMKTDLFWMNSLRLNGSLAVPFETAKKIKMNDISILAIGSIDVKNIKHKEFCYSPTISSPIDGCTTATYLSLILKKFYIYHPPSGEIFLKKDID
jgi:hypothetical protein